MIKGLTDRAPKLPRLGKIRLGVKQQGAGGREFPQDTDHFVLTDVPEVASVYGDAPKKLIAMFATNDPEVNFPTRLEAWKASSKQKMPDGSPKSILFCSSDGETATRLYVGERDAQGHAIVAKMAPDERPDEGEMFEFACPFRACNYYENRGCRQVGRLNVLLPQVSWSGVYQIETSSLWAFGNVQDAIVWMHSIYGGRIALKPFELTREPVVMMPPELKGKSIIKHVLHLRIIDHHNLPQIPPPPFMRDNFLVEAQTDRPEDLFPGRTQAALPPMPEDKAGPDPLEQKAAAAGLTPAQLEMLKARMRGDVALIERELDGQIAKLKAAQATVKAVVAPAPAPAPPPARLPLAAPKQEEEPPHSADDPDPLLGF
jgi:Recombination directionality factor-like